MALTYDARCLNEELSLVVEANKNLKAAQEMLSEMKSTNGVKGISYGKASKSSVRATFTAQAILEKEEQIEGLKIKVIEARGAVKEMLSRYEWEDSEYEILKLRYIDGLMWKHVANTLNYTERRVRQRWEECLNNSLYNFD